MAALNVQWERPGSPQHLWFPIRACSFFRHCAEPRKRSRETDLFVSHFAFTCCGSEAAARSGAGRLAPVCLQYLFTSAKNRVLWEWRQGGGESAPFRVLPALPPAEAAGSCGTTVSPCELWGWHAHQQIRWQSGTAATLYRLISCFFNVRK